ncbi:hypothetical protein N2152v2_004920 [Parachlorella kessleri]
MLACKFMDDRYFTNNYYAQVGGVSLQELNSLELELLGRLGYRAHVDVPELCACLQYIQDAAARGGAWVAQQLTLSSTANAAGALVEPCEEAEAAAAALSDCLEAPGGACGQQCPRLAMQVHRGGALCRAATHAGVPASPSSCLQHTDAARQSRSCPASRAGSMADSGGSGSGPSTPDAYQDGLARTTSSSWEGHASAQAHALHMMSCKHARCEAAHMEGVAVPAA